VLPGGVIAGGTGGDVTPPKASAADALNPISNAMVSTVTLTLLIFVDPKLRLGLFSSFGTSCGQFLFG